jgi:hypothetical protein
MRWGVAYAVDPVGYACAMASRSLTRGELRQYMRGLSYQNVCA